LVWETEKLKQCYGVYVRRENDEVSYGSHLCVFERLPFRRRSDLYIPDLQRTDTGLVGASFVGLAGVLYSARVTGLVTGGALLVPYFSANAAFRSAACNSALVGSCTAALPSVSLVTRSGLYTPRLLFGTVLDVVAVAEKF
jgi:hypothetical protein